VKRGNSTSASGADRGARAARPGHDARAEIARHRRGLERRYVNSARYTLEVDFREYAQQLRGDLARGRAGA
jgi:hypothetical protein